MTFTRREEISDQCRRRVVDWHNLKKLERTMTDHIIYKYVLPGEQGVVDLNMPEGATVLYVASVNDVVCLWARVKPDAPIVAHTFAVVGTGAPMEQAAALGSHVGTAVTLNGRATWHVFDLGVV